MSFKERYLEMKENNLTDKEIALEMGVCRYTITKWKKIYGVSAKASRKNYCNVSEKSLREGEKRGISRRLLLQRVRLYGYTEEQAIYTPIKKRKKKGMEL